MARGEFLMRVGLILDGRVGIAAFFDTKLNMPLMLDDTMSGNPWTFALTAFITLAGRSPVTLVLPADASPCSVPRGT